MVNFFSVGKVSLYSDETDCEREVKKKGGGVLMRDSHNRGIQIRT